MTSEEYKLTFATHDEIVPQNESECIIYELIAQSANDSNSAMFREDVTKLIMNRRPSTKKLGYDDDELPIEVKPRNYTNSHVKLHGEGSFSDFTWARHKRHIADNVQIIISGFSFGKILYAIEIPYSTLISHIEKQLFKFLPNGDVVNHYARKIIFSYKQWAHSHYKMIYIRPTIDKYKSSMSKDFYTKVIQGEQHATRKEAGKGSQKNGLKKKKESSEKQEAQIVQIV
jgi:hypothetical protein